MWEAESTVNSGIRFFDDVMRLDSQKNMLSKQELENRLTDLLMEFSRASGLTLKTSVSFQNVHELMNMSFHTELAYVRLNGENCELIFHDLLLSYIDRNAGLIFVAKSWVLLLVIEHAKSKEHDLAADFIFEVGDSGSLDQVCFTSSNPAACFILDYDFAVSNGYQSFRNFSINLLIPWEDRVKKVFWRGSTTGQRTCIPPGENVEDDFGWLPRLKLCVLTRDPTIAHLCDAGISTIVQVKEKYLEERISSSGLMKPPVSRETFAKFRAVFDIDGNANAWSGLFCSLLGGSCVLKVASARQFREWYYPSLVPWVHYVPISADMFDLPKIVQWFASHDDECKEIGSEGRKLALSIDLQSAVRDSAENFVQFCRRIHS